MIQTQAQMQWDLLEFNGRYFIAFNNIRDFFQVDVIYENNYYKFANNYIKKELKGNNQNKKYYNFWCDIIFGNMSDFCGKFNENYLKEAISKIKEGSILNYSNVVDEKDFLNNKLYLLLNQQYEKILKHNKNKISVMLKKVKRETKDQTINKFNTADCCICANCINLNKKRENILLKCSHVFHTTCIGEWMLQSQTCPICRDNISIL